MQLNVLAHPGPDDPAWYDGGLRFTCSQCGNCCTGGPGYVWISREEIVRLAEYLGITPEETVERYCRKVDGRFTLKERRTAQGLYDCIFLREEGEGGRESHEQETSEARVPAATSALVSQPRRHKACSIYPVRPLQCRTWPFWPENLAEKSNWDRAAKRCHGMNSGRTFTRQQIEAVRDAADWPANPPTSAGASAPAAPAHNR